MEQIIKDNKIYRFNLESKHITDERRKYTIKNIIDNLKNPTSIPNNLEKFNSVLDKVGAVKIKKPFYRLNAFQKESIIKEYITKYIKENNLNEENIIKFTKQILSLIKDKKLSSSSFDFNQETHVMNNIKKIQITNDGVSLK